MAKLNYPEELTNLVEEYLTDGIISEKERQVLLAKAEKLGIDKDEFDLYIDAQQQKADQVANAVTTKRRENICPFCGATLPLLTEKCPHCDSLITPETSKELREIIDNLEKALVKLKQGGWKHEEYKAQVELYIRKAKLYYGNNPKVQKLLEVIEPEFKDAASAAKKKARKEARKDLGNILLLIIGCLFELPPVILVIIGIIVLSLVISCLG